MTTELRQSETPPLAVRRMQAVLSTGEQWLDQRRVSVVAVLFALAAVAKSGTQGIAEDWPVYQPDTWPAPVDIYPPLAYGFRSIGMLVGATTADDYRVIGLVSFIAFVLAIPWLLSSALPSVRDACWAAIVIVSGPMIWVLAGGIGRPDTLALAGGLILGTKGRQVRWALLGAAVAVAASPEQAVVMSACLLLLAMTEPFRELRAGAAAAFGLSALSWIALAGWAHSLGVGSRIDVLGDLVPRSFSIFFVQTPLQVYAAFGIGVVVVVWSVLDQHSLRDSIVTVVALLAVPVGFTMVTTDQSRVFVITSAATLAAALLRHGPAILDFLSSKTRYPLAVTGAIALIAPAVELTGNYIRVPWFDYYPFLQAYVLDRLPLF